MNRSIILLTVFVLMLISTTQAEYTINRFPVYEGDRDQTNPDIDGDTIVWQDSDTDVYWKSGDSDPNRIMINGQQTDPAISGDTIVWCDIHTYNPGTGDTTEYDIYRYDLQTQNVFFMTSNDGTLQREPDISGNIAAYRADSDIYVHPIGGSASVVAPVTSTRYEFSMDGNIAAWVEVAGGGPQIFVRDISTEDAPLQITTGSNWHRNPAVSGRMIVWDQDAGGDDYDIYGYHLDDPTTGVFAICTDAGSQKYPAISGSVVVWHDESDGAIWAVDLADAGSVPFEVSDPADTNVNQFPAISGNTIVWQHEGSTTDIYAAKLLEPSSVTVTYPNGGESIEAAASMTITWTSTGSVSDVLIEFSSNGGANWADISTVPNTGSYLWDTVENVDSTDCWIQITNTNDPTATDMSDAAFEVYQIPDEIAVVSPNGGEMYLAGGEMPITWNLVSGTAPSYVDIELLNDGGVPDQIVIAEDIPFDDYQYHWTSVADVNLIDTCRIRISDASDADPADISDTVFSIFQCDTALTADLTGDCFVDIADIAVLARQWLVCGNPYDQSWCF